MKRKLLPWIAWFAAGFVTLSSFYFTGRDLLARAEPLEPIVLADQLGWMILPVVFAIPAALIVSRQPRNPIGWLLMFPSLSVALPLLVASMINVSEPPAQPSVWFLLALWFDNWSWLLLVFPVLLIPLLFPTGRPPTPRWRWVIYFAAGMAVFFIALISISDRFAPMNVEAGWTVKNPVGIIEINSFINNYFFVPWTIGLIVLTVSCVTSLFVRYRRAAWVERAQIKWLLFACLIFGVVYSAGVYTSDTTGPIQYVWDLFFILSMMALPLAIATAILRHRLFDIDIILRKTLVYTLLTGLLGLTYFASIVSLQFIFNLLLGVQSAAAIVISTLAIAALFSPLRRRVQTFIDRRFFRQKYDAEKLLDAFARRTREETDLDTLSEDMLEVVGETMQPEWVSLWMKSNP